MFTKSIALLSLAAALSGCATQHIATQPMAKHWQDTFFSYESSLVTETHQSVFALDAGLAAELKSADLPTADSRKRLQVLLSKIYGPGGIRLSYSSGNTTGAAETWRSLKGDCLSLTILAYSAARFLNIPAQMQEVQVPLTLDRRGNTEFVNGHVNVYIRGRATVAVYEQDYKAGGMVIDFEPQFGGNHIGQLLSEQQVLARFYNNRAAQYMAQRDDRRAYSYFRAAIASDPQYAPAYANLAQLYAKGGLPQPSEDLLRLAIALGGPSYAPMRNMVQLLESLGRTEEARHYADQLKKRQDEDPYHWLALGLDAMRTERFDSAVRYLKRAADLTNGFEEVHRNLAVAYLRTGQLQAAKKQTTILAEINSESPGLAKLSRKLREWETHPELH